MGAVVDRLNISNEEIKCYLQVDSHLDDTLLQDLISEAKQAADDYLQNSFKLGDNELPIPTTVKTGVLRMVAYLYEQRTGGIANQRIEGIGGTTWDHTLQDIYRVWVQHRKFPGS